MQVILSLPYRLRTLALAGVGSCLLPVMAMAQPLPPGSPPPGGPPPGMPPMPELAPLPPHPGPPRDFEGTWTQIRGGLFLGVDLPYTPAGQDLAADRLALVKDGHAMASPHLTCRPTGVAGVIGAKTPMLFLQTPETLAIITQEDREVRFIRMNRGHPANLVPSYSGDSVGRWDGDTLVVDTIGYNGKGQLDEVANPQSAQSHVVERWTKSADGNIIDVEYVVTDPVYYTAPVTITRQYRRAPGARVGDYDCSENPREDDFSNLTFPDDTFKPNCIRPIVNGIAGDKVVCTRPTVPGGK